MTNLTSTQTEQSLGGGPGRGAGISNARRQEALAGWLMVSPAVLLLTLFLIVPFFMAFLLSFTNQRLISPNPTEFVGTRNFDRLLTMRFLPLEPITDERGQVVVDEAGNLVYPAVREFTRNNPDFPQYQGLQQLNTWTIGQTRWVLLAGDAVFMRSLWNTFFFALVVVPIQSGLALVLALLINRRVRGVNIFRTVYFMPVVVSMVVVAILWRFIYDGQNGLLNNLLSWLSFGNYTPIDWIGNPDTALLAIIAMSIWQAVGFHMVIWLAGLQNIPVTLYEAASVEGANNWQQFRYVTWPGLRNTAIFILITITIAAFGVFTQIDVMTRGGPLDSTTTVIFQAVQRGYARQDIAYGSAISVVFFTLVLLVALVQRYLTRERA